LAFEIFSHIPIPSLGHPRDVALPQNVKPRGTHCLCL